MRYPSYWASTGGGVLIAHLSKSYHVSLSHSTRINDSGIYLEIWNEESKRVAYKILQNLQEAEKEFWRITEQLLETGTCDLLRQTEAQKE